MKLAALIGLLVALAAPAWAAPLGNPIAAQQSTALEKSHVFTGTTLYSLTVSNVAGAGFLLLYNASAAPSDGSVTPYLCYPVAASGSYSIYAGQWPVAFPTGIVAVFSTGANCTTQTGANAFFQAQAR